MTAPQRFSARSAPLPHPGTTTVALDVAASPGRAGGKTPNNAPSLPRNSPVLTETNSIL
jgi:hypothetical protein